MAVVSNITIVVVAVFFIVVVCIQLTWVNKPLVFILSERRSWFWKRRVTCLILILSVGAITGQVMFILTHYVR